MLDLGILGDPAFVAVQCLNGLTQAMFLFLIASGLTPIFGVLGVLNFAHGSLYMLGAYLSYTIASLFVSRPSAFWVALVLGSLGVALAGGLIEAIFLRPVYRRAELDQLLVTSALVLLIGDVVKFAWGPDNRSISRPAILAGSVLVGGRDFPTYNLVVIALGPLVAAALWLLLTRTQFGRLIRAAASDREMVGVVGADVSRLFTGVFVLGAWLGGLGGGLAAPVGAIYPGMDVEVIAESFIVVVVGGMGSLTGTLLGSLIIGQLNTCGLLLKKADVPFAMSFLAAPVVAAAVALLFGLLCIRLTRIYFSMLTLAFSQIVWAIAFKWYSLTGGDNGLIGIPVPTALADPRALYLFTVAIVVLVGGLLWRLVNAPFGRTLLAVRENAERAEFVGIHVRRVQLAAFVISGAVSGLAGALFSLFSPGAFPAQ